MSIRRLSVQLANQIAAGEVVERPASVVKELLENAIDSGATRISLEIENAGRSLISVSDNGQGIEAQELPLALAPHATSKISTLEDLEAITTLGFRGEALASIAAVSKLTLTSKTAAALNAYQVQVQGPQQDPVVAPAAHPNGTSVQVRELFFNTPARRRFLRSDKTELQHIKDVFVRTALSHNDLDFSYKVDDKVQIAVKGCELFSPEFQRRLVQLTSNAFKQEQIRLEGHSEILEIKGVMLLPSSVEAALADELYLFLNGRAIADRMLIHAIKEAAVNAIGPCSGIKGLVYLKADEHSVDVNVHPRKDEVRFHHSRLVHDTLVDCVYTALGGEQSSDLEMLLEPHTDNKALLEFPSGTGYFLHDPVASSDQEIQTESIEKPTVESGPAQHSSEPLSHSSDYHTAANILQPTTSEQRRQQQAKFYDKVQRENLTQKVAIIQEQPSSRVKLLTKIGQQCVLVQQHNEIYLLNAARLDFARQCFAYQEDFARHNIASIRPELDFSLKLSPQQIQSLKGREPLLTRCGFEVTIKRSQLELKKIPQLMEGVELASAVTQILDLIIEHQHQLEQGACPIALCQVVCQKYKQAQPSYDKIESIDSMSGLCCLPMVACKIDLNNYLALLCDRF